jgi:hypothetical protein
MSESSVEGTADSQVWHLKIKIMSGAVLVVSCPNQDRTLVAQVKENLELRNAAWPAKQQSLMLPSRDDEQSNADRATKRQCLSLIDVHRNECAASSIEEQWTKIQCESVHQLQDHLSLGAYGLTHNSSLELLVKDAAWRKSDLVLQSKVMHEQVVHFESMDYEKDGRIDKQAAQAIALVLAVRVTIRIVGSAHSACSVRADMSLIEFDLELTYR